MSNPSLPPVPPMAAASSPPLLRRLRPRDPDDDEDALEEGELRVPVLGRHESSDSDTEDDDPRPRYLFQPRVDYDGYEPEVVVRRPQHHHRRSPPRRPRLAPLDILFLGPGAGAALPSPTPSGDCDKSDATLSDDDHRHGSNPTGSGSSARPSSSAADAVVGRGWAATGKRGWKAGGNDSKKPAAVVVVPAPVVSSDLKAHDARSGHANTAPAATGDGKAGTTTSISGAQAAPALAAVHHQQPPIVPPQAAQPPRAPQQPLPPRRARERATEYTCKECGKSYPTNQALGGHAAGHKNKRREAEAMAAAMAAAAAGDASDASLAAAFLPLRRGGGKADGPHECRKCGKVFASGVALGGHMRVHYTGPPIVPTRKNKKRCLAPPPPPQPAERDIVAVAPPSVGLSLALSIKTEEESPPPPAVPAGGAVRVVRLFGIDISPQDQAPLQQRQLSSGGTTEDPSAAGQQQH